jgi:DNA-directed RNA polymerase specialized sigma24 family protein
MVCEDIKTSTDTKVQQLYEAAFPNVARFVSKMGGSFADAKDIFHDALVIYIEKSEQLSITVPPEAYVLGIAKHLWIRNFNKSKRHVRLSADELMISLPEDYFPSVNTKHLFEVVKLTGKKCMELLHGFYYGKNSMKELATSMGFSGEHSATVQKYKCLEKIRETIRIKSIRYEDFLE